MESNNPVSIDIKNLIVEYNNGQRTTTAVNDVSFQINNNEFTVILGSSGSGKTSLLNAVGGMLSPAAGNIIYKGKDITKFNNRDYNNYRKTEIGFIFQNYNLLPDLTAKDNIIVASSLIKEPIPWKKVLNMVGLKDKANNFPNQLSGGEQQRVCIARALTKNTNILLCDEPTGALDSQNAIQVVKILQDLVKNQGIPIVMITHNPSFTLLADHCIVMSNGKIVEDKRQPNPINATDLNLS